MKKSGTTALQGFVVDDEPKEEAAEKESPEKAKRSLKHAGTAAPNLLGKEGETLMPSATAFEIERMKEIFKKFDKDGNNVLSREELRSLLKAMPRTPGADEVTDRELDLVLLTADKNDNGRLEVDEFLDYIFGQRRDKRTSIAAGEHVAGLGEFLAKAGFSELSEKAGEWMAPARLSSVEELFEDPSSLEKLCDHLGLAPKERRKLRLKFANLYH